MIVKALGAAALSLALLAGAVPAYAISNVDAGVARDTEKAPPLKKHRRHHHMHRAHKPMHHHAAKKPMHHHMAKKHKSIKTGV